MNKLSGYKLHTLILTNLLLRLSKLRLLENFLRLLDQIISQDIVNIVVNSFVNMNTSVNVHYSIAMNDSVNYVENSNKCLELEAELIKQHNMEKVFVITTLKNNLRKFKGKDIVNNAAQVSNATTIALGMYKLNPTMEQAAILKEIVEQAKSLNPLDSASYSACKYVKLIQELLGYVRDTFLDIHKPSEKLVAVTPINKKKTVSFMFDDRNELCFLEFVSDMNTSSKSKSVKKAKKKKEWKPTRKVFTKIRYKWRPTERTFTLVRNACPLTRITATNKVPLREPIPLEVVAQESVVTKVYTRRPKIPKSNGSSSKPKIAKSVISNKTEPGTSRGSNTSVSPSSSSLVDLSTVKFGNEQITKIIGYGDYQIGNITISRVYYVEGLGHNLFSIGQFCDSDLEVVFRKQTCFVHNLEGNFMPPTPDFAFIGLDEFVNKPVVENYKA
ncbi:hypothetical protein Tco_0862353 [Tanacetum coccineum]